MVDLKKLKEFKARIEKVALDICEYVKNDLDTTDCSECPYSRLCQILTTAKCRMMIMQYNPENPNKIYEK